MSSISHQVSSETSPSVYSAKFNADLENKLPTVPEASFDSYVNQHKDECLPGTRTDILDKIKKWYSSPHQEDVFWLNGTGTGKSTISRTIAKFLSDTR